MKSPRIFIALLWKASVRIFFVVVPFIMIQGQALALTWDIEAVDSNAWSGYGPSMAVDVNGNTYISYSNQLANTVNYAYQGNNESSWTHSVVIAGVFNVMTSLALDLNNNPHISYAGAYASLNGSNWNIEATPATGYWRSSLVIDKNNIPHISTDGIAYETRSNGSWNVKNFSNGGSLSSLALDKDNNPHISYFDMTSHPKDSLKYVAFDGTNWMQEIIDPAFHTHTSFDDALALDSQGVPHVVYYEEDAGILRYATRAASGWEIEDIGSGLLAHAVSLVMDKNDHPVIAYIGAGTPSGAIGDDLFYLTNDGTGWSKELVTDSAGTSMMWPISLALDSEGDPNIAFSGGHNNSLMIARGSGAATAIPEPSTVLLLSLGSGLIALKRYRRKKTSQ